MSNNTPGTVTKQCSLSSNILGSPIQKFRRALSEDIDQLQYLYNNKVEEVFGNKSIGYQIERCYFSMVAINTENKIVGLICLDDHPNIPALPPCEWENWIKTLYNLNKVTPQNTLWIHLMVCDTKYIHSFSKPLLEQVYLYFPLVTHLIAIVPGNAPIFCFLEEHFTCVVPNGYSNPRKVQTLYITWRHHYKKTYKIRLAVEEDNDDIVPLIHTHSERLMDMYGEFYISELLTKHHGMDRKLIVAEIKERAAAVLILNGVVNYDSLYKEFQMEPFINIYNKTYLTKEDIEDLASSESSDTYDDIEMANGTFRKSIDETSKLPVQSLEEIIQYNKMQLLEQKSESESILEIVKMFSLVSPSSQETTKHIRKTVNISPELPEPIFLAPDEISYNRFTNTTEAEFEEGECCQDVPESNKIAFTLEVMAAGKEIETAVLNDLLEASFQSFTKKNYCFLSMVHSMPHFPLLDYFVKVSPRKFSIFPQELYVLHKNSIKAQLEVHQMHKAEFCNVAKLIGHMQHCPALLDCITKSVFGSSPEYSTYVMKNYNTIVAIIVLRLESNIEYFLMNYKVHNIVDFLVHKYDKHGVIEHCIHSPIFQKHIPFFLRETHRLSDMSIILYKLDTTELSRYTRLKPLPAILKDMLPVKNRTLPEFSSIHLQDVEVPEWFLVPKIDLFALFISTPRICSLPRIDINSRLVVIGDGSTAISFLQALTFEYKGRNLANFNNLHIVFDEMSTSSTVLSSYTSGMFVYRGKFSANYLFSLGLRVHVNFIYGSMTAINRKEKYVTVNNDYIVPYDYLFLMCGLQYTHPYSEGVRADRICQICPKNVFAINKYKTADIAIRTLIIHAQNVPKKRNIVVYGASLNAYCCLATVLALDIKNYSIAFVEPYQDEHNRPSLDVFNNPPLHEALHAILEMEKIETYEGYFFSDWQLYPRDNFITAVKFQSRHGFITLPCDFFFCYCNKEVAHTTFSAINSAGIVYDGRVVIQPDCRTNDPYIFAAGPMTKYARRFYADKFVHAYYNSHEIGERLARQVRAMLLPGGLAENKGDPIFDILNSKQTNKLVPLYVKPITEYCMLPGGIRYFSIRSPGKQIPYETYISSVKRGHIFETGDLKNLKPTSDPMYFRIEYNLNNFIDKITCFTKQPINIVNYSRLWGKHEKMLNNLQKKFVMGLIPDFYEFFKSSYFCAIYSDTFMVVQEEISKILKLLSSQPGQSLIEDIINRLIEHDTEMLSLTQAQEVEEKFLNSHYHIAIVQKVMEFLGENYRNLPMYAHPLVTKLILEDVTNSPLFLKPVE